MTTEEIRIKMDRVAHKNLSAQELQQEISAITNAHLSCIAKENRLETALKEKHGPKALEELFADAVEEKGDDLAYD